ncbi:SDR family oxidoreductase [Sphingobium sp.]|uniref:SDR family oxidoreductase n=1 Tax=Sphingobium sp. TaxID=1912891 RepID=UPI0028BDA690|nr:SDR family oxidoreductase [Sphingobium sp.]
MFDLHGRVVVITGGSRGLGLQIAEALGEFGAKLMLVSRKQKDLDGAAQMLADRGIRAETVAADLGNDPAAADLICSATHDRLGPIDILVNNAGATWGTPAEDHPMDAWDKVINLNLTALFRLTRRAAREDMLPRRKGAILNIASIEGLAAHHPDLPGTAAYNASKGGVINLTRALAAEWADRGVRVNALAPGHFSSKMTAGLMETSGERLLDLIPMKKFGGPDDLKGAALLMVSDAGGHITGQTLAIDGGATII